MGPKFKLGQIVLVKHQLKQFTVSKIDFRNGVYFYEMYSHNSILMTSEDNVKEVFNG